MYCLFLSEAPHFLLTLGIALLIFCRYRDWRVMPIAFLFGIFIDIDHLFDYYASCGPNLCLTSLFDIRHNAGPFKKIYVFLHGWEWLIPLWLIAKKWEKRQAVKGLTWVVTLSFLGHLLIDNFSYSHYPLAYSFIYRLLNSFSRESFDGY